MYSSTVIVPYTGRLPVEWLKASLAAFAAIGTRKVVLLGPASSEHLPETPVRCMHIATGRPFSGEAWREALLEISTPACLCINGDANPSCSPEGLRRMVRVLLDTASSMVYSHYREETSDGIVEHATIDYQIGSLRDGFDFGPVFCFSTDCLRRSEAAYGQLSDSTCGALYDLRLRLSIASLPLRLPEALYTCPRLEHRPTGQQIFDYVDPRNREAQIEMERIATEHLMRIGAGLKGEFDRPPADASPFPVEASVIIPVRNRVKTIADAVRSVLSQKADFDFNVIIVDNHSTDGTGDVLDRLAREDRRVIRIVPATHDLGIGGCWNLGLQSAHCGRIAAQLDSDDLYASDGTLQILVDKMNEGPYAMVVGSYRMVNFDLQEIPPGVIDHREWTRDNGRNNLLRVNGIGAPRVFQTSLIRENPLPNASYGEDYAAALRLSRQYDIGRIFEPVYLCRRWDENTDANLSLAAKNAHDLYKDRVRSLEVLARLRINRAAEK